jgi:hypothetical protein
MGYRFLLWNGGLYLGYWGGGSLSAGFGAGNLGMGFCPGNLRGVDLNEGVYELFWF